MWEIIARGRGATIWQSRDAEGRRVVAWTRDRDGAAQEPTSGLVCPRGVPRWMRREIAQGHCA